MEIVKRNKIVFTVIAVVVLSAIVVSLFIVFRPTPENIIASGKKCFNADNDEGREINGKCVSIKCIQRPGATDC